MVNGRVCARRGLAWPALLLLAALQIACGGAAGNSDPPPAIASITVTSPVPSIAVNGSVQFSASVQNSADGVLWQVNAVSGGNSAVGTISPSGLYTAPAIVPS